MYQVTKFHYKPCYRKGDLEEELVIVSVENFKLKKDAVQFCKSKRDYKQCKFDKLNYYNYTGETWVNENTGETREEFYLLEISKIKF